MSNTIMADLTAKLPMANVGAPISHDFDFWFGRWHVRNERLVGRLEGSQTWEEFDATVTAWPILEGLGNMDEFLASEWKPAYTGMSLRLFNPGTRQWSIYWMDSIAGTLEPPVVGGFKDGTGIFFGTDTLRGRPIDVRFIWSEITANSARWEQAFSPDRGVTWETNWIMRMRRMGT
jgi:hypothetical protein